MTVFAMGDAAPGDGPPRGRVVQPAGEGGRAAHGACWPIRRAAATRACGFHPSASIMFAHSVDASSEAGASHD